jgi:hypothetical protein
LTAPLSAYITAIAAAYLQKLFIKELKLKTFQTTLYPNIILTRPPEYINQIQTKEFVFHGFYDIFLKLKMTTLLAFLSGFKSAFHKQNRYIKTRTPLSLSQLL